MTADPTAADPTSALTLQLLAFVAARERSYAETMEAWRTTCPRLTIWEDAVSAQLVRIAPGAAGERPAVVLTPAGMRHLAAAAAQDGGLPR